jgi:hypothetical protein
MKMNKAAIANKAGMLYFLILSLFGINYTTKVID